jgi:hypothetical protein
MNWADRYRGHAADCVRLAHQTASPTDKALLLQMAERWVGLAERAEMREATDKFDGEK